MIAKCDCKHEGQDELHGKGNRVHNPKAKDEIRCTVCKSEKKRFNSLRLRRVGNAYGKLRPVSSVE